MLLSQVPLGFKVPLSQIVACGLDSTLEFGSTTPVILVPLKSTFLIQFGTVDWSIVGVFIHFASIIYEPNVALLSPPLGNGLAALST